MIHLPRIFHRDIVSIHHAAFWLAFFAFISGLIGLLRDRLLASMFGASRVLDIYYAAFRVPDFVYTLMLFLTATTAVIPFLLKKNNEHTTYAEEFLGSLLFFFIVVISILSVAVFFLMPIFSNFLFPGFVAEDIQTTILLSRILLFSPIFLGFSNIFSSITQSFKRFFAYALSPVFYNAGIILGITVFFPAWGMPGLGVGVALGALLHAAIQFPSVTHIGIKPTLRKFLFSDIKRVIALSFSRTLGLATTQISIIIFTAIASTLAAGSIAILNLAQNLEYIPITIIGLSYSVAAFPSLASFSLQKAREDFEEHFSSAFRHIMLWTIPFSALLLILRAQVVRVVLGSGAFGWEDTRLTAASLFILSLSVVFQSLFLLLVRAFYAEGKTTRPLIINVLSVVLSVGAALWFVVLLSPGSQFAMVLGSMLDISDIADIRVIALPLGILLGSVINFTLLLWAFKMVFGWFPISKTKKSILEILSASAAGASGAYAGLAMFSYVFNLQTFLGIFLQGLGAGIVGLGIIVGVLLLFKNQEFFELQKSIKGIFLKDKVATPEPEKLP